MPHYPPYRQHTGHTGGSSRNLCPTYGDLTFPLSLQVGHTHILLASSPTLSLPWKLTLVHATDTGKNFVDWGSRAVHEFCIIYYGTSVIYPAMLYGHKHKTFYCAFSCLGHGPYTVFIRILAVATITFNLAGVRLLIEGASYSKAAFINLERHLLVTLTQ